MVRRFHVQYDVVAWIGIIMKPILPGGGRHFWPRIAVGCVCAGLWLSAAAAMGAPALPIINTNNVVYITDFGAVSSTTLTNTTAIQNAINSAATTNGGCTVEIPAGIYLSGPLTLANNINLQLDSGAILRMLPFGQYPLAYFTNISMTYATNGSIVSTNFSTNVTWTAANFITGTSLHDIAISGAGAIDGQGLPWWPYANTNGDTRPIMIRLSGCNRELIQGVTLSNSPMFHISISGKAGNTTVQGVIIRAPSSSANPPSHNTDACDVSGTNVLVQNCDISVGDDNFTCGGGTSDVLITNNTYGNGHGISIGSYTDGGVSNITVINCTINGADNGIRIKSDNDRGGLVQNISYCNIGMTNVHFPIQIYSYYTKVGTPSSISPYYASTQVVATVTGKTPIYRNISFSNINATSISGYPIGIIWARTEMPATNIVFNQVNVTGNGNFCLYNVSGARFIDCNLKPSTTSNTFALFNAQVVITNSVYTANLVTLDGLTTNGFGNSLVFYNARTSLKNTNVFDDGPLTIADSLLTVSNNLMLFPSTVLNYSLDANTNRVAVAGNLTLGGTINITNGPGFGTGTYTLLTYTGTLSGNLPTLGSTPAVGYTYSVGTNTAGQVNLIVVLPVPSAPTNLTAMGTNLLINLQWNAVSGALTYNLKRGTVNGGPYPTVFNLLPGTNYSDAAVTNAVTYYYVVTAVSGGESTNSLQVSATPLPSAIPTNLVVQVSNGQLQLSWPQSHLGWHLQAQTNDAAIGLGTNWVNLPDSATTNQMLLPIDLNNGTVFLRLSYP